MSNQRHRKDGRAGGGEQPPASSTPASHARNRAPGDEDAVFAKVIALVLEARRRYDKYDFDEAWIARVENVVGARWPRSSMDERRRLVELMELTPSLRWMHDYLVPAERHEIVGADLLIEHFEQIASMFGEAVDIRDGFTAPSWGPDAR